jgi:hypothetical protein
MNRNGIEAANDVGPAMSASAEYDHVGRRLRSLEQCALHKRTLRLTCPRCGHVRVIDAVCLWWMFHRRGWDGALPSAAARLCCAFCRERGATARPRITVGRDAPTGEALPYPDEATWKKLVSRYRS